MNSLPLFRGCRLFYCLVALLPLLYSGCKDEVTTSGPSGPGEAQDGEISVYFDVETLSTLASVSGEDGLPTLLDSMLSVPIAERYEVTAVLRPNGRSTEIVRKVPVFYEENPDFNRNDIEAGAWSRMTFEDNQYRAYDERRQVISDYLLSPKDSAMQYRAFAILNNHFVLTNDEIDQAIDTLNTYGEDFRKINDRRVAYVNDHALG